MTERLSPELEDLHAFVDGQLSPDARGRVEAQLASDPAARRQAGDYAAIRQGLKALYDPVASERVPERLRRRPWRAARWVRPFAAMAASLFLLVTGAWVGMHLEHGQLLPGAGRPDVVREAAMAYAVYSPEVRHPVEVSGDEEPHLVAWLTKRMGAPLHVPRLDALGFRLLGGRLMSSDDGPGALLMYENKEGRRVVLYACRNDEKARDTAFRYAEEEAVSVFYWFEGALSYALAGDLDRPALRALTESAYRQITI